MPVSTSSQEYRLMAAMLFLSQPGLADYIFGESTPTANTHSN
jgi:hypothetical protein